MKTVNVAIPLDGLTREQVFEAEARITAAIGDAGERGDSGIGMGYRDIEYTGPDIDEIIKRVETVAPEGTICTPVDDI